MLYYACPIAYKVTSKSQNSSLCKGNGLNTGCSLWEWHLLTLNKTSEFFKIVIFLYTNCSKCGVRWSYFSCPFYFQILYTNLHILHDFKLNKALKTLILTFRKESQLMTAKQLSRRSNMSTIALKTFVLTFRLVWNLFFIVWGLSKKDN